MALKLGRLSDRSGTHDDYSVWLSCGDGQKIFPQQSILLQVNEVGDRERTIPSTGFGFTALVAEDLVLGKLRMLNEGASWWQPSVDSMRLADARPVPDLPQMRRP
jgi:hypothetical protein